MPNPTVCAVMKATLEISVRPSSSQETFAQMFAAAKSEAEAILRNRLEGKARVLSVEFSHATIVET